MKLLCPTAVSGAANREDVVILLLIQFKISVRGLCSITF